MVERQTGPRLYRRGPGVLRALESMPCVRGSRVLVVGGHTAIEKAGHIVQSTLAAGGAAAVDIMWYGGECNARQVDTVSARIADFSASVVVGVGGGKALDTTKLAAFQRHIPVITIPTIAATCAAWTPVSAFYNEAGEYLDLLPAGPPIAVLADTGIITEAPRRYLSAGVGDTLAKRYELEASTMSVAPHEVAAARGALSLGEAAYQILAKHGERAMLDMKHGRVDGESLGVVVDAIIMLAGTVSELGGNAARTAAAHAIYSGLSYIPATHAIYHGELVAFGILAQLFIEGRSQNDISDYLCTAYGSNLPITLAGCNLVDVSDDDLMRAARASISMPDMANMSMPVTAEMVLSALKKADQAGQSFLKTHTQSREDGY